MVKNTVNVISLANRIGKSNVWEIVAAEQKFPESVPSSHVWKKYTKNTNRNSLAFVFYADNFSRSTHSTSILFSILIHNSIQRRGLRWC